MKQLKFMLVLLVVFRGVPELRAEAALFLEQPFGGFGEMNP